MSFTTSVVLIAVFDVLIIAALAAVCLVPFRIDRRRHGRRACPPDRQRRPARGGRSRRLTVPDTSWCLAPGRVYD